MLDFWPSQRAAIEHLKHSVENPEERVFNRGALYQGGLDQT